MARLTTDERRQQMRQQIMEAALPLFAEKGFAGTSNRDIAAKAGIKSTGLLYWYFTSKEEIFTAILDEFLPFANVTLPLETMTEVPPQQLLPLLVQGLTSLLNDARFYDVLRLLIAEVLHSPEGTRLNQTLKRIFDPLTSYFRAQITLGCLRDEDPLLMAQMFVSSIGIFFARRRIGHDATLLTYDIDQVMRFVVEAFLRAFAP